MNLKTPEKVFNRMTADIQEATGDRINAANRTTGVNRPVIRQRSPRAAYTILLVLITGILFLSACADEETVAQTTPLPFSSMTPSTAAPTSSAPTGGNIHMKIDAKEAKRILDTNKNAILLDVRTVEENRDLRIPGSKLIPIQELPDRLAELPRDPNRPILIYCRSGNRSAQAAALLKQAGFPVVYDFGGIIDWPYETEKG